MRPRYQEIPAARIPVARSDDGRVTVRVLAGEALGARAAIETRTPIAYLHLTLEPGARLTQAVAPRHAALVYVFGGEARVGPEGRPVRDGQLAVLREGGDAVALAAADGGRPVEALLLAGEPLREPVARYGPFVMNTQGEIRQAILDYQAGRMGEIAS
jgi:redox-sensitive bicupin YhaK (pirin superfamily)